jgi:HD superfamily phosphohydrolase
VHVVRDVVHGYVSFDDDDRAIIDTSIVQRLRYIRQNDVAFLVYPSLNTTRFEHSLGVFHVARQIAHSALESGRGGIRERYLDVLRASLPEGETRSRFNDDTFERAARWYGLLHDVGHLPFSHLVEFCLGTHHDTLYADSGFQKLHESAGSYIVRNNTELGAALDRDPAAAWIVRELLAKKKASPALRPLKDIVDADVDADRIDSTARDGLQSGGDYGNYDIARLAREAHLVNDDGKWRVLFTTRALSAIEALLGERCKTHRWIHYQQKVVALKNAFRHAFGALTKIAPAGNYKENHPERRALISARYREKNPALMKYLCIQSASRKKGYAPIKCSKEEFLLWFAAQDLKHCKMCGRAILQRPNIDHCHKTGKLRGILCTACNTALGFFEKEGLAERVNRYLALD